MKFSAVLLIAGCLIVCVKGVAQQINLSENNASIEKVFRSIEKQSGYLFWYEYATLQHLDKINVNAKNLSLNDALDLCIKDQPIKYSIVNKTIVITRKTETEIGGEALLPEAIEVSGRVTDTTNAPLEGVSISVENLNRGVTTSEDGNFRIQLPASATLRFTRVGYHTIDIKVSKKTFINVSLSLETGSLNDVVVIGYGSLSRRNITSAVSSINIIGLKNQPIASVDQAIAAQAAGVRVSQLTGTPGGGATIRVRGTGSVSAGNEPLIVIDGFPVEGEYNRDINPLATINPNDIESIQILKDASSVAIYGSRGSNGVVLITTKRGISGKSKIQFDSYYGIQQIEKKIDMLDAHDYAIYNTEARNNAWADLGGNVKDPDSVRPDKLKIPPMFRDPSSIGKGTDWQDEIFQSAPIQNHQVSIFSGNEKTQYMLSLGYFNQNGIVINTGFERYSLRFNLDSRLSDKFKIGLNLAPSYNKNQVLPVEDQVFSGGILGAALAMPPTVPVFNDDGSYTTLLGASTYDVGLIDNPVAIANQIKSGTSAFRTLGNVFAEWEIIKGLNLKSSLGGDFYEDRFNFYWPSTLGRSGVPPPVIPEANASTTRNFVWLNENTVSYNRLIKNKHFINAVAGYTSQRSSTDIAYLNAVNFPNDLVVTLNGGQINSGGTGISEWSLSSFLGRVNYSYDSRYVLTATIRRDGSSRFGADNKWGTFPSASVGWNISQEKFMRPFGFISELKLRASYGYAGNNAIGNYNSFGLLSTSRYVFGSGRGGVVNGLDPVTISNPLLGWEKMKQTDIGIDAGIIKNRVSFIVDYFDKVTSDLLLNVPVPASTGFSTALQNIGKVSNKGWEFTINSNNLVGAFKWRTNVNLSAYKNKVLALGQQRDPIISTSKSFSPQTHITKIGEPLASFYGYQVIGVYRDQADIDKSPVVQGAAGSRPGDLKFKDVNNDGVITPLDITIIGNNIPDFSYGLSNDFSFKNFSLSILIDGIQGSEVLNGSRRNIGLVTGSYSRKDVLGRWQSPENPGDGKTPRANFVATGGDVSFVSSLLVEDASFLRLRNINLRYSFPRKIFKTIPVENASVFFSVQNAYTFTNYKGYNPEQSLNGANSLTPGVDFNGYPLARVFSAGVSLTFQ